MIKEVSKYIATVILLTYATILLGQQPGGTIKGTVVDSNNNPIPFATIAVKNTSIGTVSNARGEFILTLTNSKPELTLVIRCIGFEEKTINISFDNKNSIEIREVLNESSAAIDEVVISAKSKAAIVREESYAVEVLESKTFKNLAVNANEILNKVPGVNIRQSGGFGASADLSLNGLTGSQVRVFIDGIPMEYFGSSLGLNNFPANLIEHIEVYKGVVPIHLSSDALGGAVNITTNKNQKSFIDASYGIGSFNTHNVSLNAQYRDKQTGFTGRVKSFYNYSDNNYKVDVNLWDATTGQYDDHTTEVEHFYDAYNSKMGWVETGFTGIKLADELMIGLLYSDNYNEIQQPESAIGDSEQPYGEVLEKENKLISTFNYSKKDLFAERLSLSSYIVYVNSEQIYRNISDYEYDWFGNKILKDDKTGEGDNRKSHLTLDSKNVLGNFNIEYAFSDVNNLALNYNVNFLDMEGQDAYNGENNTRFSQPIAFSKQVLASSYTHTFFDNKFRNTAFAKYYKYAQNSTDTDYYGEDTTNTSASYNKLGFGLATSYFISNFQFKISFENALRFPELIELYGDGRGYDANHYLMPEESTNYNLGAVYKNSFTNSNLMFSVNGFIRDSKDFIFAQRAGKTIVHKNLDDVLTTGVDFSANYKHSNKFNINIAGTYINQVNNDKYIAGGKNSLYKERVPNEPYLYGNATVSFIKGNLFKTNDSFSFTVNENYVHEFNYRWGNLGFSKSKYIIPSQLTTDLDFVYSLQQKRYNFSFGIINVFDADTYDNLFQQNPGRSYNFKIRYFIN